MSTRERSPNYPAYSLRDALGFANLIYEQERRSTIPMEAAAKALGSQSLSGPARSKIAALRHFGLLDSPGSGRVKLTERALVLVLHRPDDPEFVSAARDAALDPPLFHELYSQFGESSNETLRIYLIKDRSFSDDGAKRAISTFRQTIEFAQLSPGEEVESRQLSLERADGGPASNVADFDGIRESRPFISVSQPPWEVRTSMGAGARIASPQPSPAKMALNWLLPDGVVAQLSFVANKPTPRAIQRLIDYLKFLKDDLPADVENAQSESHSS